MSNPEFKAISVRPCKKCGTTERYNDGHCKQCKETANSVYRAGDRVEIAEKNALRRAANRSSNKAATAAWYRKNGHIAAKWREEHREYAINATSAWCAANPEAKRIQNQNRRAKKRDNGGTLSKGLTAKLFKLQKGMCPCCNQPLGDDYHLDHQMPLALGGSNSDCNMQLLRATCNLQKNSAHPVDFMQRRGFLL